jgi:hypothetical protein
MELKIVELLLSVSISTARNLSVYHQGGILIYNKNINNVRLKGGLTVDRG